MTEFSANENYLDLRGTPCPKNFICCKLAMEDLKKNQFIHVDLDKGEPELMVISGLKNAGHQVEIIDEDLSCLRLKVICGSC